jgi:SAM-dependent methyltransferase
MPEETPMSAKDKLKQLSMRAMRPGLESVHERLGRLESQIDKLHGALDQSPRDRVKYDSELEYWRYLVKNGGAKKDFGESFEVVFGRWMRRRLEKLGVFLGLPSVGQAGDIDEWCVGRSVVEIGAGPYPAVAAARRGWKRCVAVDPIARGYVEDGLVPESCGHVVYIEAPGERIPLSSGSADLVVCENCLDHVTDPASVIREIERLLAPGGHLWIFVDLSEHQDHMHPHPMSEEKMRKLLGRLTAVRVEVSSHRAHPEAYGGFRALYQKPTAVRFRDTASDDVMQPEDRLPRAVSADRAASAQQTGASSAEAAPNVQGHPEIHVNGSVLDRVTKVS